MDFTFGTESANEFLVFLILAVLGQTAETRRTTIQCLGTLVESLLEAIVDESLFQNLHDTRETKRGEYYRFSTYRLLSFTHHKNSLP